MASPRSDGSGEVKTHALEDEDGEFSLGGSAASGLPGIVPVGVVRRVRGRDGQEEDKVALKLRACISCRLVMTEQQFYEDGCPNCAWLQIDGDKSRVHSCTSANFSGFIAIAKAQGSWVARYNRLTEGVAGCYAVTVLGDLPDSVKDDVHRRNAYAD